MNVNKVINQSRFPITLDCGVTLSAAETEGSTRENVELSDKDRRLYVDTGRIIIPDEHTRDATEGDGVAVGASVSAASIKKQETAAAEPDQSQQSKAADSGGATTQESGLTATSKNAKEPRGAK